MRPSPDPALPARAASSAAAERPLKVLLPTLGSAGDLYPVLALALGLKGRGHHPVVVANDHYATLCERVGVDLVPLGTEAEFGPLLDHPDLWHPRRSFPLLVREGMAPLLRPLLAILEAQAGPNTVVAASCLTIGARVAQELHGLPLATVLLQPSMLRSVHASPVLAGIRPPDWMPPAWKDRYYRWVDRFFVDPVMVPAIEGQRAALGLPAVRRHLDRWIFSTERILGLFPDWFAPPQPDWPAQTRLTGFLRFDPADLAPSPEQAAALEAMEAFLAEGEAPLVFTPGSAMKQGRAFFRAAADAARRLGRRAILLSRFAEQIPEKLPAGVRHFSYLPLGRILPRAAAFVHHGGIGSAAQALGAGIPQLVMPLAFDQFDNAWRLERLGVGRSLAPRRFRGPAVAAALRALLDDPTVAARARNLAAQVDDAAALAASCAWIEALAAG